MQIQLQVQLQILYISIAIRDGNNIDHCANLETQLGNSRNTTNTFTWLPLFQKHQVFQQQLPPKIGISSFFWEKLDMLSQTKPTSRAPDLPGIAFET